MAGKHLDTRSLEDAFGLGWFVLSAGFLAYLLVRLVALRRNGLTAGDFLLAGPMLFVYPDRYFADGHGSAPWRALLYWALWLLVSFPLSRAIPDWLTR